MKIKEIIKQKDRKINQKIELSGWIRYKRTSKSIIFLNVFDGSYLNGIQVVVKKDENEENFNLIDKLNAFSSIVIVGTIVQGKNDLEILLNQIKDYSKVEGDFPIGKKEHGLEFLREVPHLRIKTKLFQSIMKIRSISFFEIQNFFNEEGFLNVNSPIITSNDSEGAGESFYLKDSKNGEFFSNQTTLTVSGQLHVESYAQSLGKVYSFGPTFRAENSNTTRHASEFWMLEPEAAFYDYNKMMSVGEKMIKTIIKKILSKCPEEIMFLDSYFKNNLKMNLEKTLKNEFKKISYTEAIKLLQDAQNEKSLFKGQNISFGIDLSSEQEKYLSKEIFDGPIFVYDYPKEIKAFYMYQNDDKKTVRGFDLLVPGIGELIGGSQREESYEKLLDALKLKNINMEELKWYLDFRKNGYSKSSGFGIGFERLIMFLTGASNIRDVIPYPIVPGKINF